MSTTDHQDHRNPAAPQCPTPVPDPIRVLREAVGIITRPDHKSIAEATDQLVALAGLRVVCLRWVTPLHQRRHPSLRVPTRVWSIVLTAAAPTRPTPIPTPNPTERTVEIVGRLR